MLYDITVLLIFYATAVLLLPQRRRNCTYVPGYSDLHVKTKPKTHSVCVGNPSNYFKQHTSTHSTQRPRTLRHMKNTRHCKLLYHCYNGYYKPYYCTTTSTTIINTIIRTTAAKGRSSGKRFRRKFPYLPFFVFRASFYVSRFLHLQLLEC